MSSTEDRLAAMIADLQGHVERRAEEIAAPRIADAEQRVAAARREAAFEVQHRDDVIAELRRHVEVLDRDRAAAVDRVVAGRTVLRRTVEVLRDGHEVRPALAETAALLASIGRYGCPGVVVDDAVRLATALTTVPKGEPLDARLTEVEREETGR